jgi:uncharacterized membrane protein
MNERRVHQIFEISVLLKGAHALIECIGGLALTFASTSTIRGLVNALTQEELIEDPNDFVAGHLLSLAQNFTVSTQRFYAFYLLSHGLIKGFLSSVCLEISSGPILFLLSSLASLSPISSIDFRTRTASASYC